MISSISCIQATALFTRSCRIYWNWNHDNSNNINNNEWIYKARSKRWSGALHRRAGVFPRKCLNRAGRWLGSDLQDWRVHGPKDKIRLCAVLVQQVYRSRYDKPPLAVRCCRVASDLTNFTDDRQTNEQTDRQPYRRKSPLREATALASDYNLRLCACVDDGGLL